MRLDGRAPKASLPACSDKRFADAEQRQRDIEDGKRRERIASRLRESGIPRRHADRMTLQGVAWIAKRDKIEALAGTGYLVALIGDRGRGKTQMGVDLIERYISDDHGKAVYVKAMDFFMAIRQTYSKGVDRTENDVIDDYIKPGLLVIDAIEVRAESPWEDRLLNHLIDRRYDDCRDTLLIGNISQDELTAALGHSIVSRATETGGVVVCDWESYRGNAK